MLYHFYRPQRSCGQGYVFTRVCDSVNRGEGVSGQNPPTPWDQADPPAWRTPQQGEPPLGPGRHPLDQADTPWQGEPPRTRQTPPRPGRHPWQGEPPPPPAGRHPPPTGPGRHPSGRENRPPPRQADTPQQGDPPPRPGRPLLPREEDCSIRSMSGRYASY